MRFRKSVKLCKGVRLNFSGSGVSMSLGVRGASMTFGKNGAYANYGIPGTGLYNRVKIASGSTDQPKPRSHSSRPIATLDLSRFSYDIFIDDRGQISLDVKDPYGRYVTDNAVISRIRRSEEYRQRLNAALAQKKTEVNDQTLSLINIVRLSEKVVDFVPMRNAYEKIDTLPSPEEYFTEPMPSKSELKKRLELEAAENVKSILFWTNSKKRQDYVDERLESEYSRLYSEWESSRKLYVEQELEHRENEKTRLANILRTDTEGIYSNIDDVLNNITLPVDFSVNYEIENRNLYLDLDLPEIEDMPTEKAQTLASGRVSIKQKTQKEQSSDYALCVCGMSYFLSSLLFNTTPEIDNIFVSAYTQRQNNKSGEIEDQYVYSVRFDRDRFSKIDFKSINPVIALYDFPHNIQLSKSNKLETIDLSAPLSESPAPKLDSVNRPTPVVESSVERESSSSALPNVRVPRGCMIVEDHEEDKTKYCLDPETFMNIQEFTDENGKRFIIVNRAKWKEATEEMQRRQSVDDEIAMTASLNNEGIALEKDGKEDEAIAVYEQNVARKSKARHSYDRLLVLYKKRKDKDNELRIAKVASSVFPQEAKYKNRLELLLGGNETQDVKLPTEAIKCDPDVKHGDIFAQRIMDLPEFDYYNNGNSSNAYKVDSKCLAPIWEIQRYFKNLFEAAELAESKKDYENAAMIYEQIVGEHYWMPSAYDRLVKIYAKAKLKDAEIRVLNEGIAFFTDLRERRLEYVRHLARKYNSTDFLEERVRSGGKITYFNGVFELYNPFPIVEKWKERLEKKQG